MIRHPVPEGGSAAVERVVTVDGRPVRYLTAGTGPAVVLLHGLGESPADWAAVLARLAPSRAVYAPALPGFGGQGDPADVSSESYARFVGRFLDALEVEREVSPGLAAISEPVLGELGVVWSRTPVGAVRAPAPRRCCGRPRGTAPGAAQAARWPPGAGVAGLGRPGPGRPGRPRPPSSGSAS